MSNPISEEYTFILKKKIILKLIVPFSTPLHQAVISRNQRIFDLLLTQLSLDTNLRTLADEHPPLYYALVDDRRASISSSETLVMNGSNPFDTPVTNKNAFSEDSEDKTDNIVERDFAAKLLARGCQPNPLYSGSGDSLLHILTLGWFEVILYIAN